MAFIGRLSGAAPKSRFEGVSLATIEMIDDTETKDGMDDYRNRRSLIQDRCPQYIQRSNRSTAFPRMMTCSVSAEVTRSSISATVTVAFSIANG